MQTAMKSWSHPSCTSPAEMEQDCTLSSFISSQIKNKYHFYSLFYAIFFLHFCAFFYWWFCCLKWPQSIPPELLLHVPKCKQAMKCHMEKIYALSLFHSVMNYIAPGHELNANESIRYIKERIFKHTHKTKLWVGCLMKTLWPEIFAT